MSTLNQDPCSTTSLTRFRRTDWNGNCGQRSDSVSSPQIHCYECESAEEQIREYASRSRSPISPFNSHLSLLQCRETAGLHRSIRSIGIGTYIASAQGPGYATHRGSTSTSASRTSSAPVLDELNLAHQSAAEDPSTAAPVAVTPSLEPVIEPVATPTSEQPHPVAISQALSENEAHPITSATLPQLEEEVLTSSAQTNPESISNQHAPLATATLDTTVFDVVHLFSERGISAVPILDEDGFVVDLYETVDVIVSIDLESIPPLVCLSHLLLFPSLFFSDSRPLWSLSITWSNDSSSSSQKTSRLPRCLHLQSWRFTSQHLRTLA